jgi:hypothetical protein
VERNESGLGRNAALLVLLPIGGLLGGILFGVIRARIQRGDEFAEIALVVQGAFLGSVLGAATAVAFAVLERKSLTSLQRMLGFIVVAGVLLWALVTLLRDLVASGVI